MAEVVSTLVFEAKTGALKETKRALDDVAHSANDAAKATDHYRDANGRLRDSKGRFVKSTNAANDSQKKFSRTLGITKLRLLAVGAAVGTAAFAINRGLKAVEEAGANFSILNARLVTATGSTASAASAFKELNEFALETPFTLDESVNGFAKLVNLGLDPSRESMVSFANTSAAMGTSLEQMIEAVADATTFEFERLKEFGIKTKQENDTVKFSFRGTTTEVAKNADAVKGFLENIGNTVFAGAAIEQTKTLAGSVSNLKQGFSLLTIAAGEVAGANEIFAKSNNDLAKAINDPEFQEGLGILTRKFAELKASAISFASATAGFIVDIFTTTEAEAQLRVTTLEGELSALTDKGSKDARLLRRAISNAKEAVQEIQDLKGEVEEGDGTGLGTKTPEKTAEEKAIEERKNIQKQFEEWKQEQRGTELDRLKEHYLAQQELEEQFAEQQRERYLEKELAIGELRNQGIAETLTGETDMFERMKELREAGVKSEDLTQKEKNKLVLGMGAQLAKGVATQSKKGFELMKKVKIAEALISGRKSVLNSYEEGTEIGGPPVGAAFAALAAVTTMSHINAIKNQQFSGGGSSSMSTGGGGGGGSTAITQAPIEPEQITPVATQPTVVNVSVDNSIDPEGARRIVEAINEATSDGLEITALVS